MHSFMTTNLLEWSHRQWSIEASNSFSDLRRFDDAETQAFLSLVEGLPSEEKVRVGQSLSSWRLGFGGQSSAEIANRYFMKCAEKRAEMRSVTPPKGVRRELSQLIAMQIQSRFSDIEHVRVSGVSLYSVRQDSHKLETYIDTSHRFSLMSYFHRVRNLSNEVLCESISHHYWMGLAGQTMWRYRDDINLSTLSAHLLDLMELFISTFPELAVSKRNAPNA